MILGYLIQIKSAVIAIRNNKRQFLMDGIPVNRDNIPASGVHPQAQESC
jgi:hypothetical protein